MYRVVDPRIGNRQTDRTSPRCDLRTRSNARNPNREQTPRNGVESRKSPVAVQLSLAVLCKKKGIHSSRSPGVAVRWRPRNWALIGPARPQCTKEAAWRKQLKWFFLGFSLSPVGLGRTTTSAPLDARICFAYRDPAVRPRFSLACGVPRRQVVRGLLALSLVVPLPLVLGCSGASPLRAGTRQSALGSCATPRLQCYVCTSHGAVWRISARSTRARAVERPPGVALCGA